MTLESAGSGLVTEATRPTSLTVAIAVGVGLVVPVVAGEAAVGIALVAAAGGGLGVAALVRTHDGPAAAAAGAALAPVVAVAGGAGVALLAAERGTLGGGLGAAVPAAAVGVGAGTAAFGATVALDGGVSEVAVRRVHRSAMATAAVIGVAFVAVLAAEFGVVGGFPPAFAPGALLGPVLSPGGPTLSLVTFFGLVVAAALAGRWALSALPVVEMAPRARREAVERTVERLDDDCRAAAKYGVVAASASLPTAIPLVRETLPVVGVAALVAPSGPRLLLLFVAALAATLALLARLLRAAAGAASTLGRLLPATVGGLLVVLVAIGLDGVIRAAAGALPATVRPVAGDLVGALSPAGAALGVAVVAVGALTVAVTTLRLLLRIDLVPTRGNGGALAGTGLSTCAVVVGVGPAPAIATFVLVGLGVVAWDVSDQGAAVRADLGPQSAGGVEAVHAVGSVAVAAVGVGVAWATLGLVGAVALPDGALVGAVAAVAAAVVLLGVLRA
jgi:hypothetical protein